MWFAPVKNFSMFSALACPLAPGAGTDISINCGVTWATREFITDCAVPNLSIVPVSGILKSNLFK